MLDKSLFTIILACFYSFLFSQTDTIPPIPACNFGIGWNLVSENDSIHIDTFINKTHYSESELEELHFSFSKDITDTIWHYDCDHGLICVAAIEVWVTDQQGNQSFCETFTSINFGSYHPVEAIFIIVEYG